MMLLILMYHRIYQKDKYGNCPLEFEEHLRFILENYPVVTPGDSLDECKLNICLSFDDATCDFYHVCFPLLEKYKVKVLLGVCPLWTISSTNQDPKRRLEALEKKSVWNEQDFYHQAPFCTWEELQKMHRSSWVRLASHSYSHANCSLDKLNFEKEIIASKTIIEKKIQSPVDTFIYPYGKYNKKSHYCVKKHYKYALRIGSACNYSWNNSHGLLYRINADNLKSKKTLFSLFNKLTYRCKYLCNTLKEYSQGF